MKRILKNALVIVLAVTVTATFIPMFGFAGTSYAASKIQAPKSVTAVVLSKDTVQVKWSKVKGAKNYLVYKDGKKVKTLTAKKKSWKDADIEIGKEYKYFVKAKKGKKISKKSKIVKAGVPFADKIFENGVIYTVEGANWDKEEKSAMAVDKSGKLLYVGTNEEAAEFATESTVEIDLEGKYVYPGFIDSHDHPPGTSMTDLFEINLYYDFDLPGTENTIKTFVEGHPDADVYWGNGFNYAIFGGEGASLDPRGILDAICADKPMILTSNDGHSQWLNSKALEECGITKDTPAIAGGDIKHYQSGDKAGEPNGLLTDCHGLITIPQDYTKEQNMAGMKDFTQKMNAWGFVGCSTGGQTGIEDAVDLDKNGELTLRMNYSSNFVPEASVKENIANLAYNKKLAKNSDNVIVNCGKFFLDGVVEGYTAYMSEPYVGEAAKAMGDDYVSEPKWPADGKSLKKNMLACAERGVQIHVHSIGDEATTLTLDSLAYAQKKAGKQDYRNVITHLQVVKNADKKRMAKLNVIGALQPFWHLKEPDWFYEVDNDVLGEDRAALEYPAKSLQDEGVVLTFSGDFPVSPTNNPFWAIEASVTRNLNAPEYYGVDDITDIDDPTYLLNAAERVDIKTAIEAYTINGAYQMFAEDFCGSLKEGKVADFIVLDRNPLTVDPLTLDSIQVLETYKDGKSVYKLN